MGHAASLLAPVPPSPVRPSQDHATLGPARQPEFAFRSLVLSEPRSLAAGRGVTLAVSIFVHAVLLAAAFIVPLLVLEEALPSTELAVRAFFAAPPEVAPPPPPPPPPPAGVRQPRVAAAPVTPPPVSGRLVAPVEVPEEMPVDEGIDMGVEGGVPGGVEGGVPGGVVGGIIGGLPPAAPPEPPRAVVRVGGNIRAPKLIHEVKPVYPPLALQARVAGIVILEAHVGTDGRVRSARVLRGHPLLDEAAMEAVKQRRYQPLLLNGVPTEFILTLTMTFRLTTPVPGS